MLFLSRLRGSAHFFLLCPRCFGHFFSPILRPASAMRLFCLQSYSCLSSTRLYCCVPFLKNEKSRSKQHILLGLGRNRSDLAYVTICTQESASDEPVPCGSEGGEALFLRSPSAYVLCLGTSALTRTSCLKNQTAFQMEAVSRCAFC